MSITQRVDRRLAFFLCVSALLVTGCTDSSPTAPPTAPPTPSPSETPLDRPPTVPVITELCWDAIGIPTGYCQELPLEDDLMRYWCVVGDDDGDALQLTLSFTTKSGCATPAQCWSKSGSFAARSTPSTVRLESDNVYFPEGSGKELTCRAVDSHGFQAEKTFCLESGRWPSPGPCP